MVKKKLKILVVGDFVYPWYQEACVNSLLSLGYDVKSFGWGNYFHYQASTVMSSIRYMIHKAENKFKAGPTIHKINNNLLIDVVGYKPDVIFFYNVHMIYAKTVLEIKKKLPHTILCQYANDNPFGKQANKWDWRHFVKSIPYFDLHFVYRNGNVRDFMTKGAKRVYLLRSYFIKEEDFEISAAAIPQHFVSDVVFAGHYADDGRLELLEEICASGYQLKIFGAGWDRALKKMSAHNPLRKLYPIYRVFGDEYRYAICGAKVALCFLSKLNEDTYTRRNFQIPAMKSAMLSEYTDDLATLFIPNREARFFRNKAELLEQLDYLLKNPQERADMAMAGFVRVHRDAHDVTARMAYAMKHIEELL